MGPRSGYTPPAFTEYMAGVQSQKESENVLLSRYEACPAGVDSADVATYLAGVDVKKLKADVGTTFYNANVMTAMACVASGMTIDTNEDAIAYTERIRNFLLNLKLFGAESVSGFALRGSIATNPAVIASDVFVVKAPRAPEDGDELIHECIVAFYATNRARARGIVNFAYVYGSFMCSPPFIDTTAPGKKDVIAFCNSAEGPVSYAIYENIAPATGLGDYALKASPKEFLDLYLQMIVALYALRDVQFVHYDCHGDNVLVRTVSDRNCMVQIDLGDRTVYFKTPGLVSTLIDYGMSHVTISDSSLGIRNGHYGHVGASAPLTYYGVYRDRYNPLHDPYKLLCFCLHGMQKRNKKAFDQLAPLLRFFGSSESPAEIMSRQRETYFAVPWFPGVDALSGWTFIEYILSFYRTKGWESPMSLTPFPGLPVIGCTNACLTIGDELVQIGLTPGTPQVETFFEFYDAYSRLYRMYSKTQDPRERRRHAQTLQNLTDGFKSQLPSALSHEITQNNKLALNLKSFTLDGRSSERVVLIPTLPTKYADLLYDSVLRRIKAYVRDVVIFFDTFQRLELSLRSMYHTAKVYGLTSASDPLVAALVVYKQFLDACLPIREFVRQQILKDAKFIAPELPSPGLLSAKRLAETDPDYEKFKWYWVTFPSLVTLVNVPVWISA